MKIGPALFFCRCFSTKKILQKDLLFFCKRAKIRQLLFPSMIYAVLKKNENNEKLMRRFKKQVQKSGIIKIVRENRYQKGGKTKVRIRQEAIKREEFREKKKDRILWA